MKGDFSCCILDVASLFVYKPIHVCSNEFDRDLSPDDIVRFCKQNGSSRRRCLDTVAGSSHSGRRQISLKTPGMKGARSCILDVTSLFVYKPVHVCSNEFDRDLSPDDIVRRRV